MHTGLISKYERHDDSVDRKHSHSKCEGVVTSRKRDTSCYQKAAEGRYSKLNPGVCFERANPKGWFHLGECFRRGEGVVKDLKRAAECYQKAAEGGNPKGWYNLGNCFRRGEGVVKNLKRAAECYQKAGEVGDPKGWLHLGKCFKKGRGVVKDLKRAAECYQKAGDLGDPKGWLHLGKCFKKGRGVVKDLKRAVECFVKACQRGDPNGWSNLGVCYRRGEGVVKDLKRAAECYKKAGERGDPNGWYNLGVCFERGEGVVKDFKWSAEYYQKAAEGGHPKGWYNLGLCFKRGTGVVKDHKRAAECYKKGFEAGDLVSKYQLALCFQHGEGVPKDPKRAEALFQELKKASGLQNGSPHLHMAHCLEIQHADKEYTFNAYKEAACVHGDPVAHSHLGYCYLHGFGVQQDWKLALTHFKKAIKGAGDLDALHWRDTLLEKQKLQWHTFEAWLQSLKQKRAVDESPLSGSQCGIVQCDTETPSITCRLSGITVMSVQVQNTQGENDLKRSTFSTSMSTQLGRVVKKIEITKNIRDQLNHVIKGKNVTDTVHDDGRREIEVLVTPRYVEWRLKNKSAHRTDPRWFLSLSYWFSFETLFSFMEFYKVREMVFLSHMSPEIWKERYTMEARDISRVETKGIGRKRLPVQLRPEKDEHYSDNMKWEYKLMQELCKMGNEELACVKQYKLPIW
eukprot:CAMPEP_0114504890 /NCGR_PEP_ID=MMETSP0109-20121206/10536_1 /TAXON_ID=29199 /ORGANISM="Chlorarachnion reptans, Strain CCCM449" /LENGTH=682 /DNA_ID=CAMNT_0001683243 /DNA_START=203 /DNA_END=2248 /DNA_ORIENTATION=+